MQNLTNKLPKVKSFGKLSTVAIAAFGFLVSLPALSATSYRVKSGDTLNSIAKQYDVSVQQLINVNNLKNADDIKVGDLVNIADINALNYHGKTVTYIIQPGDSFLSIAKKYNTSVATLAELNDIKSDYNQLYVGQKFTVPFIPMTVKNTPTSAAKVAVADNTVKPAVKTFTYEVQPSDSITSIASKFKMTSKDLLQVNNLTNSSMLYMGQKLQIPATADRLNALAVDKSAKLNKTEVAKKSLVNGTSVAKPTYTTMNGKVDFINYQVKAGDSLIAVAKRYNTTPAGLAKINNLDANNYIQLGQTLLVPVQNTPILQSSVVTKPNYE